MMIKVGGTFTITVRRADGSVKQRLKFDNLITNSGMDRIAGPTGVGNASHTLWDRLSLSTNAVAPTVTDSAMGGTIVSTTSASGTYSNAIVNDGASTYQNRYRSGWRFNAGSATGTWSSLGLLFSTTLFCRALITAAGVPTTLTVLATESLDIRYEFRVLPPMVDGSGSVTINGTAYNYTSRVYAISALASVNAYNVSLGPLGNSGEYGGLAYGPSMTLGAVTAGTMSNEIDTPFGSVTETFQAGGSPKPTSRSFASYTAGSFTRSCTVVWGATKVAPSAIVKGVWIHLGGIHPGFQFLFATTIPKTASEQLSLTFTVTWARL